MAEIAVADWLRGAANRTADQVYLDDVGSSRRLSFAEVDNRVDRLVGALRSGGLKPGDRIAILATDCHAYVETLWASMRCGAVFVPLNVRLAAAEVHELLAIAGPRVIFASVRYAELARDVADALPHRVRVITYDAGPTGLEQYEQMLVSAPRVLDCTRVRDGDLLGLAFTSGTTGLPKAVMQSQRMVKNIIINCVLSWETGPGEVYYSGAPLFHISGMSMVLMGALTSYTCVLAPQFDPAIVAGWIAEQRLTSFFAVPSMIASLLEQPRLPGPPGSEPTRLRAIHYGAAPMPLPLLRRAMASFRCEFVQAFGAGTESGWNTCLTSADHRRALAGEEHLLGSVGRAAPGVELRICDDAWNDVSRGEIGEVVVRSDMIMSGYLDEPELTAQALHADGWFRAGDIGRLDDEGYLYLVDRKKDLIVRGGENIYPAEIERVLYDIPGIVECAVVGVPDDRFTEVPRAHLVVAGPRPAPAELERLCRARLASFKVPRSWVFESELPHNASGKILKRKLVES